MQNKKDLTGQRFGKLTVISFAEKTKNGTTWNCICDCGNEKAILGRSLTRGKTKSCGCASHSRKYKVGDKFGILTIVEMPENLRHGKVKCLCDCGNYTECFLSNLVRGQTTSCGCLRSYYAKQSRNCKGESRSRLYKEWSRMKTRCYNKNIPYYHNYGGRGIKVCDEWQTYWPFREWAIESGYEDTLTLDRIDVDGDYSPENCRWITMAEQSNNKRTNRFIEYNGKRQTIAQWAREIGIDPSLIRWRLENGKSVEESLSPKKYKRKE